MKKKFAVVLSGCGFKDGSEITESVCTLIALTEAKAELQIFAPDLDIESTDHLSGKNSGTRNLLVEAARIARGKVKALSTLKAENFDGLAFPGGYGAALHLCTFAKEGANCSVLPEAEKIIRAFHAEQKPILGICIAPALIAKVLGQHKVTLTIGNDTGTALEIQKTGAIHENCPVTDFVSDRDHKVITTPAYMYDEASAFEVFTGIQKAVREFIEMA